MMDADQVAEVLRLHKMWRDDDSRGVRANLSVANLFNVNLAGAELGLADLTAADLTGANLAGANLVRANLAQAILTGANLARANLTRANLSGIRRLNAELFGTGYLHVYVAGYSGYVVPQRLQIGCVVFSPNETQALLGPGAEAVFCAAHVQATPEVWRIFGPAIQGAIRSSMAEVPERWEGGR